MNKNVVTVLVVQEDNELIYDVYGPDPPFWVKRIRPAEPDIGEVWLPNLSLFRQRQFCFVSQKCSSDEIS